MVPKLTLWFSGVREVSLLRTYFCHPLIEKELHSIRGKTPESYGDYSTFQWTPAVQALSILLTRTALGVLDNSANTGSRIPIILEGEKGTPAASLDYALGKQTNWLLDMFGLDFNGTPIVRKFVRRYNPERKRPGPVKLSVDPSVLPHESIKIIVDGIEITSPQILGRLVGALEKGWNGKSDNASTNAFFSATDSSCRSEIPTLNGFIASQRELGPLATPFDRNEYRAAFRSSHVSEISEMIRDTPNFDREQSRATVRQLNEDQWLRAISPKVPLSLHSIDDELTGANRFGVLRDQTKWARLSSARAAATFCLTPAHAGTLAILNYLRFSRGLNISVNYRFADSIELSRSMIQGTFDQAPEFCVVSIASAFEIIASGKSEYIPLMLFPKISFRAVSGLDVSERKGPQHYLLCSDGITSSAYYLEMLVRAGVVSRSKTKISHMEPHEVLRAFDPEDPSLKAVLWFPHHHLQTFGHMDREVRNAQGAPLGLETILFMHRSLEEDPKWVRFIDIAIRDAWLSLRQDPRLVESIVDSVVEDRDYIRCVSRYSGLYHFASGIAPSMDGAALT